MTNRPAPIVLNDRVVHYAPEPEEPEQTPIVYAQYCYDYYDKHIYPIIKIRQFITDRTRTASEIVEGIWLGNGTDAMDSDVLMRHCIDSIVNCAEKQTLTCAKFYPYGWNYLGIACDDDANYDILGRHREEFMSFMDKCIGEKKKVLVHCAAGINRSATLLIAYLVERRNMCLKDAISLCFEKRPIILTNKSFVLSLIERYVVE